MLSSSRIDGAVLGSRQAFPELQAKAYLAHAAVAPAATHVVAAMAESVRRQAAEGLAWIGWAKEQAELARQRFGALIGLDPLTATRQVARVANTSTGVIDIAFSMPWKSGDRVLVVAGEFPTNVTPWRAAAQHFELELASVSLDAFLTDIEVGLAQLEAELARGVRLVAVCAVQFQYGLAMPLERIGQLCRQHGARLFVDGIQAVGTMPLDVAALGIDYFAAGAHKWLMGCLGAAYLYVSKEAAAELQPRLVGWMSHRDPEAFLFAGGPRVAHDEPLQGAPGNFEQGVLNYHGCAASAAGMGPLVQLGPAAIRAHVQSYLDALEAGLLDLGFESLRAEAEESRSAILAVRPPAGVALEALHMNLFERGIVQTAPDGVLRLAPHWPNPLDEVDFVVASVREALGR